MHLTPFLVVVAALGAATSAPPAVLHPVPCVPVEVFVPPWVSEPAAPRIGVVDSDIRPERARLYLDQRFIGIADQFDGLPDYLYLDPGRYLLEARLGGYRTARFEIDVRERCRYPIKHRMERIEGEPRERRWEGVQRIENPERFYAPVSDDPSIPKPEVGRRSVPDVGLRPELPRGPGETSAGSGVARGSLELHVTPATASVWLDGVFLATAAELRRLTSAIATTVGDHAIEVMAPGYRSVRRVVTVEDGEILELRVELEPEGS